MEYYCSCRHAKLEHQAASRLSPKYTNTCTVQPTHTQIHKHMQGSRHTHTCTNTQTHAQLNRHTYTCTNTYTAQPTHAHMYKYTNTCTAQPTHAHMHKYTNRCKVQPTQEGPHMQPIDRPTHLCFRFLYVNIEIEETKHGKLLHLHTT